MEKYIFELDFKVRDYECDLQGIVNNANYLHYFEHTRHEFLDNMNINVLELHNQGIDPVIARVNMALKTPLTSGDEFVSKLFLTKEGIKYTFHQDLFRKSDNRVVAKAKIEAVTIINGRLSRSELFDQAFAPYIKA
ncbi:acyl-CoA thioesterase [Bacteroides propionicifaciens]|uniref:acyl-CoA thioesterase n=1 Tax=Bacteroides propionicifaciens TaxID=392838 RepID=UPI00036F2822|nr:acyl-CoA thioesterase [Bacteroides propionicifaciens]